jgi:hypothetical protein
MTIAAKRITIATVKSFIRKNRERLLINVSSRFDGMQDMAVDTGMNGFAPIRAETRFCHDTRQYVETSHDNASTMGISGVWFVGSGNNWCNAFETETHRGFTVDNCCGSWTVAVAK